MATLTAHCPRCQSERVYHYGKTLAGHARYRGPIYPHAFQLTYTYEAHKPRMKNKIVYMASPPPSVEVIIVTMGGATAPYVLNNRNVHISAVRYG